MSQLPCPLSRVIGHRELCCMIYSSLVKLWLQPLEGDWREKVLAAKAKGKDSVDRSAQSETPNLAQLSASLPQGWTAMWDAASKRLYYGNQETQVCTTIRLLE